MKQLVVLILVSVLFCGCAEENKVSKSGPYVAAKSSPELQYIKPPTPPPREPLFIELASESWEFEAKTDGFSASALLDLSYLNTPIKDINDRIVLSEEKNSFAFADGRPFRVWAVNLGSGDRTLIELDEQVAFLAKRGVNMVRLHTGIHPKGDSADFHSIDKKVLDRIFRVIPALRKHGVYLTLSTYWGPSVKREGWRKSIGKDWPVPRNPNAKNAASLLFFDPLMQEAYRAWLTQLMTTVNPYTGVPLKDEPALAVFQLQNEDSLLFWSAGALDGEDLKVLSKQFGLWLTNKYGSLKELAKHWQGAHSEGAKNEDEWDSGIVALSNLWHLTRGNLRGGFKKRIDDQTQFLVETMRDFNQKTVRFLRDDIKTPVLLNAGNWKTVNAERLDDLERYSYTPGEVLALNRYMASLHQGENNGWAITNGQKYSDASVLLDPQAMPLTVKQVEGHPFIITESSWVPPVSFQAEGAFLVSTYQSINGVDGFYWFSAGESQWRKPSSANGYLPSLGKWVVQTPMLLGQFPAAALSYRLGYVSQAEPSAKEYRVLSDMYQRKPAAIFEKQGYDVNRDKFLLHEESTEGLAFLVGPVVTLYGEKGESELTTSNKKQWIDGDFVVAGTGQLHWDVHNGVALLDAPASQAVCGFLNGAQIRSSDVLFDVNNPYACIWLVSMEKHALNESGKILLQMGTRQFPSGWKTKAATLQNKKESVVGREILNFGSSPWRIESLKAKLKLKNSKVTKATVLDENGLAVHALPIVRRGEWLDIQLPADALYVMLSE